MCLPLVIFIPLNLCLLADFRKNKLITLMNKIIVFLSSYRQRGDFTTCFCFFRQGDQTCSSASVQTNIKEADCKVFILTLLNQYQLPNNFKLNYCMFSQLTFWEAIEIPGLLFNPVSLSSQSSSPPHSFLPQGKCGK